MTIRERLPTHKPRQTLNTPEHRWLRAQLDRIVRRLGRLQRSEEGWRESEHRERVLDELETLKGRMVRLRRLEPIASAEGTPPHGFASLRLMTAPGYQDAYRDCLVLSLGLRIEGGPLRLSAKRISLLYEYWCYLALLRLVAEVTDSVGCVDQLFSIRQQGLHVLLKEGRQTTVPFQVPDGRTISVSYNARFQGDSYISAQKPDLLISFEDPNWHPLHLLLDAKYRIDGSPQYRERYGTPGPPEDAINVLHRYRDAILEEQQDDTRHRELRHTVVEAAAAFPYREESEGEFEAGRLWQALRRIGVGAIPLLPGHVDYLRQWIRSCLRRGGWALADRAIGHRGCQESLDWRRAASESVLVGVLRGDHQQEHLDWIREHRRYYMPRYKTQRRQYATRWVAIYSPAVLRDPGAVAHHAPVRAVDVVARGEIRTPWDPRPGTGDELHVLYELGAVRELDNPVENPGRDNAGQRFSTHRWTSRLGLERARDISELTLETEPEWRLYEDLRASGKDFELRPGRPVLLDPDDPAGRTWFLLADGFRVRYAGASGFLVKYASGREDYVARVQQVLQVARSVAE